MKLLFLTLTLSFSSLSYGAPAFDSESLIANFKLEADMQLVIAERHNVSSGHVRDVEFGIRENRQVYSFKYEVELKDGQGEKTGGTKKTYLCEYTPPEKMPYHPIFKPKSFLTCFNEDGDAVDLDEIRNRSGKADAKKC